MKVLLILPALVLAAAPAFSVVKLEPTLAASFANAKVTIAGSRVPTESITSVKGGLNLEARISSHLYLRPGILYSVYGYRNPNVAGVAVGYRYNSIEVPLYFLLKTGMPCKPRFVLGGGIAGVKTISAESKAQGAENGSAIPPNTSTTSPQVAMGVTAGIEFTKGLVVYGGYQAVRNDQQNNNAAKLYQYSAGLSYLLNKGSRRSCKFER